MNTRNTGLKPLCRYKSPLSEAKTVWRCNLPECVNKPPDKNHFGSKKFLNHHMKNAAEHINSETLLQFVYLRYHLLFKTVKVTDIVLSQ